jgi:cytoskeletal protein CcmA (bactofilin family)
VWFKHQEPKSPAAEPAAPRPQAPNVAPASPTAPVPRETPPATQGPAVVTAPVAPANASRITPGLVLKGEISGSEDLWVDGTVEGTLRFSGARVVLGPSGNVRGDVEAREVVIEGRLQGNLRAEERVEITRTGVVTGDAVARRIHVEEGAVFNGAIEVLRAGETRAAVAAAVNAGKKPAAGPGISGGSRGGSGATGSSATSGAAATTAGTAGTIASTPGGGTPSTSPAGEGNSSENDWRSNAVSASERQN